MNWEMGKQVWGIRMGGRWRTRGGHGERTGNSREN